METAFLESIQEENTSLFTPICCFSLNEVQKKTVFMKKSCVLQRFYAFFCGRDQDTMMSNVRHLQSFQVCSFRADKALCGMDVARKAASLDTAIPSSASHHCVNFVSSGSCINYLSFQIIHGSAEFLVKLSVIVKAP